MSAKLENAELHDGLEELAMADYSQSKIRDHLECTEIASLLEMSESEEYETVVVDTFEAFVEDKNGKCYVGEQCL